MISFWLSDKVWRDLWAMVMTAEAASLTIGDAGSVAGEKIRPLLYGTETVETKRRHQTWLIYQKFVL